MVAAKSHGDEFVNSTLILDLPLDYNRRTISLSSTWLYTSLRCTQGQRSFIRTAVVCSDCNVLVVTLWEHAHIEVRRHCIQDLAERRAIVGRDNW